MQPFFDAETVTVDITFAPVTLAAAVKAAILPVPDAINPTAVFVFVQLKVSPPPVFAVKAGMVIVPPEQTVMFAIPLTTGCGLMVIVNVFRFAPALVQPFLVAVTVIVPTMSNPVKLVGAVYPEMLDDPEVPSPIVILLFDQLKTSPPEVFALNVTPGTGSPEQTEMLLTALTTGSGLTVTVIVCGLPEQSGGDGAFVSVGVTS